MTKSRRDVLAGMMALGASSATAHSSGHPQRGTVERWGVHELVFDGPADGNPFNEVTLAAVFTRAGHEITVPGFYDGEGVYRIRFSPPEIGSWSWRTTSNRSVLSGRRGAFECVAPRAGNRGPVRVVPAGFHFAYADGTPYRQIGTTSYSWALQSDQRCAETLRTLASAPFNKMRMCVFPNVASVATQPFARVGPGPRDWDPARPDPAYFRRFEQRILGLAALGVEADIILFHPYDKVRGYSDINGADAERYLRYVAARWGAMRNVWWSMANEYDLIKNKSTEDWDRLFQVLQAADPHDRLRSIHQINTYYDVRKPWITHASVQNGSAVKDDGRAIIHRLFALKPVIFDEVCYEGNSTARWGNLTGEQMVERFWWGTIAGTYVGHSETLDAGRQPDTSWLGQGGTLRGSSPPRLAFLRRILEQAPRPGIDPLQPFWDYHMGGKEGEYYLTYFGEARPTAWPVVVPGRGLPAADYRLDVIDTWNMTITPAAGAFHLTPRDPYDLHAPERPSISLPGKPYLAVRLTRI